MRARTVGVLTAALLVVVQAVAGARAAMPPGPAGAPPDERPIVARTWLRVSMRGVDLYTPRGIASFYRRLQRAARQACDYGNIPGYYDKECAADALDRAVAGRGVRALDLLHASKTAGRRPARDPVVIRFVCGSDRPPGSIC